MNSMQKLEIFQSLWAMELRQPGKPERPMEENFAMVAEAGYHGLCIDPGVHEIDDFRKLIESYSIPQQNLDHGPQHKLKSVENLLF